MLDAKRVLIDAVCVAVLGFLMFWGAEAIAAMPTALPGAAAAGAAADCNKPPAAPPKETTVAGGLPGLSLTDCSDKEKADAAKAPEKK